MLNPVGILNEGRISLDTAHSFQIIKEGATGIAARYYMNRNFFVSDPDAFEISKQVPPHPKTPPLSLNEAQVSIVLAALSGGMFEIGDNLVLLSKEAARLALLKNAALLQMVRLGRAATPIDLMSYRPQDEQPSVFLLHENTRQTMLAVFNWTEQRRSHEFTLADLGLTAGGSYQAFDALNHESPMPLTAGVLQLQEQPPHSVRLIKIIDTSVPSTRSERGFFFEARLSARRESPTNST
jgi:hypothetical protein